MRTIRSLLFLFLFFLPLIILCQEEKDSDPLRANDDTNSKVRPFRIGGKTGFPNISGLGVEYVTPLFNDKLAVAFEFSKFKSSWFQKGDSANSQDDQFDFSFMSGGLNYYFFKPGKGLYGGLNYGNLKLKGEIAVLDDSDDEDNVSGKQYFDISNNSLNLKIGAKWGGGFYFRPEVGYSFNPIPDSVDSVIIYNDGTRESQTYDMEDSGFLKLLSSGLIFNIGFGFAF